MYWQDRQVTARLASVSKWLINIHPLQLGLQAIVINLHLISITVWLQILSQPFEDKNEIIWFWQFQMCGLKVTPLPIFLFIFWWFFSQDIFISDYPWTMLPQSVPPNGEGGTPKRQSDVVRGRSYPISRKGDVGFRALLNTWLK